MEATTKELHEEMLDFLRTKSNDPSELCTAAGRVLYVLMGAAIQMGDGDPDDIKTALSVLNQMKQNIIEEFVTDDNDFFGRRRAVMESQIYAHENIKNVDVSDLAQTDVRNLLESAYHAGYVNGATRKVQHDYTECSNAISELGDISEELRKDIKTSYVAIRIDEIRAKLAKYRDTQR